jgi:hypothetical protein
MSTKTTISTLQLGIDLGRVIAHTKCPDGNDLREKTTKIVEVLGLDRAFLEDPSFLIGLGFGVTDRHDTPLDEAALDLMGQVGIQEPWYEA